jgi:hypothetical protein
MFSLGTALRPKSLPRTAQAGMQLLGQTGEGGSSNKTLWGSDRSIAHPYFTEAAACGRGNFLYPQFQTKKISILASRFLGVLGTNYF